MQKRWAARLQVCLRSMGFKQRRLLWASTRREGLSKGATLTRPKAGEGRKSEIVMKKLRVGILGATGTVGQRMIQLLERHPWFEVSVVAASDNSAGKNYAQATRWMLETPIPECVAKMTFLHCQPELDCELMLSGPRSAMSDETELQPAEGGTPVLSNAS